MIRPLIALSVAVVGIAIVSAVSASPVTGSIVHNVKAPAAQKLDEDHVEGEALRFQVEYEAGQRAIAVVEGDHQPVVPVAIQVFDADRKLVGEHRPKGDVAAVVWYPQRRQRYTVLVTNLGAEWNGLTVSFR